MPSTRLGPSATPRVSQSGSFGGRDPETGLRAITELETLTINEVVSLLLDTLFIDELDAVTVAETPSAATVASLLIAEFEALTVSEVVVAYPTALYATITEAITVGEDHDALLGILNLVANESVTVSEVVNVISPFLSVSVNDSVTVGEEAQASRFSGAFVLIDMASEAVTVGESVRVSIGGGRRSDVAAIRQRYRILGERRYGNKRRIKP